MVDKTVGLCFGMPRSWPAWCWSGAAQQTGPCQPPQLYQSIW